MILVSIGYEKNAPPDWDLGVQNRRIECAGDLKSLLSESCTRSVVVFASFVSEHSQTPNKLIQFRRPIPAVSQPLLKNELWFVV